MTTRKTTLAILATILVLFMLALTACGLSSLLDLSDSTTTNTSSRIVLDAPVVTYYQDARTYDWQDVDGADYYSVDVNGSVTEVYDSQYFLVPTAETTTVTIQACADDGLKYKDSDWSETITVYTDLSTVSLSSVFAVIDDLTSKYDCTKILSVWSSGNSLYFETLGTETSGIEKLVTYKVKSATEEPIESMEQLLELSENNQLYFTYTTQDYVEYSSLESFIKSGEATTIQSYIDQGYTATVVSEAGVLETEIDIILYGTVCLEKGEDKIYIAVKYVVYLNDEFLSCDDEEYRFTTLLEDADNLLGRRENKATVLEGDFVDVFEEMLAIKLALADLCSNIANNIH